MNKILLKTIFLICLASLMSNAYALSAKEQIIVNIQKVYPDKDLLKKDLKGCLYLALEKDNNDAYIALNNIYKAHISMQGHEEYGKNAKQKEEFDAYVEDLEKIFSGGYKKLILDIKKGHNAKVYCDKVNKILNEK